MKVVVLVIFFLSYLNSFGQVTIWIENFSGYADGTTTGANNNDPPSTVDWTSGGCTTCSASAADWWEIRSGVMQARDVNNETVWLQTEVIDISTFSNVQFSVRVSETGDHEGPYLGTDDCSDQANEDYVNVLYRINGGSWTLVGNSLGWCGLYATCSHTLYGDDGSSGDCRSTDADWGATIVNQTGLGGSTLEIRLEATNSAGTEFISFSGIRVQGTVILPIELLSFDAVSLENAVELTWSTASETDNDFFTIERSAPPGIEGFIWKDVVRVPGAGNSDVILNYDYQDHLPLPGRSFYRLKQTDFDGQYSYSEVVSVDMQVSDLIYPNPSSGILIVQFAQGVIPETRVLVINEIGRRVLVEQTILDNRILLDMHHLTSGMYLVRIISPNGHTTQKVYLHP